MALTELRISSDNHPLVIKYTYNLSKNQCTACCTKFALVFVRVFILSFFMFGGPSPVCYTKAFTNYQMKTSILIAEATGYAHPGK